MSSPRYVPTENLSLGSEGPEVQKLHNYLKRFGYFPNEGLAEFRSWRPAIEHDIDDDQRFDETLDRAVRIFQDQQSLKPDGVVGPVTRGLIGRPRCGVPDATHGTGPRPFVVSGSSWSHRPITYTLINTSKDLTEVDTRAALRGAFDRWSAAASLDFNEEAGSGDMQIGWFAGDHGDGRTNAFDGVLGVLAHCFYPPPAGGHFAGDLHFDEAETWTVDTPPTGIDLPTVALHEVGHGLGLDHSKEPHAVMFAFYGGARRELTDDDIAGIRAIYGGWPAAGGANGSEG